MAYGSVNTIAADIEYCKKLSEERKRKDKSQPMVPVSTTSKYLPYQNKSYY